MNETRKNPTYMKELLNYQSHPILRYNQCNNTYNKKFKPLFDRNKPENKFQTFLLDFNQSNCCPENSYDINIHQEYKQFFKEKAKQASDIQKSIEEDYKLMFEQ